MEALKVNSLAGYDDKAVEAVDSKGRTWRWFIGEDEDGDGFTTPSHAAVSGNSIQYFNWSRFDRFDAGHFRMFVELDFPASPKRQGMSSPWGADELAAYYHLNKEAAA